MKPRAKVVITDFISGSLDAEEQILGDVADVVALDAYGEDELIGHVEEADALMVYHMLSLTARTISRLEHCKLIVRCGVGYDNVDRALARERGISVANVPDYGSEEVADSAIGMMLALARGISILNTRLMEGHEPWKYTQVVPLPRLRGRTFGIVGLGRIGTAAALRAKALGMHVVFYDPYLTDGWDKALGIEREDDFEQLLARAHVLSLHCPLTVETQYLIDTRAIAKLPKGAILVNTARGGVVDTSAIAAAIASGQLAGVGLDVLEHEPPREDDPLIQAWRDPSHPAHHRVIINPHSAFYSEEGLRDMRVKGSQACRRALLGLPLRNVVN